MEGRTVGHCEVLEWMSERVGKWGGEGGVGDSWL